MSEVIGFDFVHVVTSKAVERVDIRDRSAHMFVTSVDVGSYVWLPLPLASTAYYIAEELVTWCSVFDAFKGGSITTRPLSRTGSYERRRKSEECIMRSMPLTVLGSKEPWSR